MNHRRKRIRVDGDAAYVELSQGYEAVIDAVDVQRVAERTWHVMPNVMGGHYARSSRGEYMHRFLLGATGRSTVDHINHDTLDNRRSNLRLATNRENNQNRVGAYKNSKTGIRGVSVHRTREGTLYYVARVHGPGGGARYFPYIAEGLAAAANAVVEMRQVAMTHTVEEAPALPAPTAPVRHKSQEANAYRIEGDAAILTLTQGYETRIDVADLDRVLAHRWHVIKQAGQFRAYCNGVGYLHLFLMDGAKLVGHANGDLLDNRRANLVANANSPRRRKET